MQVAKRARPPAVEAAADPMAGEDHTTEQCMTPPYNRTSEQLDEHSIEETVTFS